MEKPPTICAKQVCSSKKVTDHHAIVPTISAEKVDIASLPLGEREVLKLAARGLLRAVDEPHRYAETVITVDCAGQSFTAKGKTVLAPGWKRYEQEQTEAAPALPVVTDNQTLSVSAASVKTGKTTPPKHFTEDTLLAAMENAGKEDMPDDAERKGIGTPATRSGIIESWCPPVLWSAGSPKRSQICCPPPPARRLSPFCLNSSSLRSSPLNGSTA